MIIAANILNSISQTYHSMASPSKETAVLRLILENSPLREWRFEELVKESKTTKAVTNKWIKKYLRMGVFAKVKQKGKYPHYTVGNNNPSYYALKRKYVLEQLFDSGLIQQLLSLQQAKTVIIFGSITRGDWYKDSDIDIFILGSAQGLSKQRFEQKLQRPIELHIFENKKEIYNVKTGLVQNVLNGYLVKGQIQDILA